MAITASRSTANGTVSGTGQLTVGAAVAVSISITPSNAEILVGRSQQYSAATVFSDGSTKEDANKSVTWSSSNTAIAAIGKNGIAKTATLGNISISASIGTLTGTTTLRAFTLTVSPVSATISVDGAQQFAAVVNFANGSTDVTNVVTWKSSKTKVASINPTGLAQGVSSGTTTITATYLGGLSPLATLQVQR